MEIFQYFRSFGSFRGVFRRRGNPASLQLMMLGLVWTEQQKSQINRFTLITKKFTTFGKNSKFDWIQHYSTKCDLQHYSTQVDSSAQFCTNSAQMRPQNSVELSNVAVHYIHKSELYICVTNKFLFQNFRYCIWKYI